MSAPAVSAAQADYTTELARVASADRVLDTERAFAAKKLLKAIELAISKQAFLPSEDVLIPIIEEAISRSSTPPRSVTPSGESTIRASNGEFPRSDEEQKAIAFANAKPPPQPKTHREMSESIVRVLGKYRWAHKSDLGQWPARGMFLDQVERFVAKNEPVHMLVPAFPFKSPNKATKVLGTLPDAGEHMALRHLQGFADAIKDVYEPGAKIFIVSDGLCYNDILGVPDQEVWTYGQALRSYGEDNGLKDVGFYRLYHFLEGMEPVTPLSEEEYTKNAPTYREELVKRFLPDGFDASKQIASNEDTALTYRGYIKFLEHDLAKQMEGQTKAQVKKHCEMTAKKMITRGKAFATALHAKHPEYVRLSIHPSTETTKLSMSLIPQTGRIATPWHSVLVRSIDGSVTMAHVNEVSPVTHELIFENGQPMYFRERSELFNWKGMELNFEYIYPTGIVVTPKNKAESYSLKDAPMQKIRQLSMQNSPVILRDFKDTLDKEVYSNKSYELGTPKPRATGLTTSVKDSKGGNTNPLTGIVTSNEAMPFHFDGFFFLVPKVQADGTTKMVPDQPRFQYFSAPTPLPQGTNSGYTVFANSNLLFKNLPAPHTVESLKGLTWDFRPSSNWDDVTRNNQLIETHPDTGVDVLRYHEPWPTWKTQFAGDVVSIENGPQGCLDVLDDLLYDRRVSLWFEWQQGDVLISDNILMMHTRTAFDASQERELWRIHVN